MKNDYLERNTGKIDLQDTEKVRAILRGTGPQRTTEVPRDPFGRRVLYAVTSWPIIRYYRRGWRQ
jgi:hypothetical protein